MTEIDLTGVVGWDVTASAIRRAIAESPGDIRLRIHSPGGDVTDGIDIANAIRAHRRAGHSVTAYVSGICMSMATYIASVCDAVEVEDNAVWMIHNPWMFALGDYRDMQKADEILSGLTRVLALAYAAKTERRIDVIRAEMDAETWLFGAEIVEAGYADAITEAGEGAETRDDAVAMARARWSDLRARLKERESAPDRIAAMLPLNIEETHMPDPVETPEEPIAPEPDPTPDPVTAERARVAQIMARCAEVHMPELAAALIERGATLEQANAAIVDAYVRAGGPEIRAATPEGAPRIDAAAIERRIFNQVATGGRV